MTTSVLTRLSYTMSFTYPCPRKLRQIMKMSMIQREPAHQVESIWKEYHNPRINNSCSVMDKQKYQFLTDRANSSPFYMIPVFRKGGHFKLLTQWQKDCFLCTFLQDFKRHGTKASPYIVFTLFPQLLFQKSIVLVRGDILNNSLTKPQAEKAWQMLEQSYTHENKFELVHNFNNSPALFSQNAYNEAYGIHV